MIEVRCPKCGKLLFKIEGFGSQVESYCSRCKVHVVYPSLKPEIKSPDISSPASSTDGVAQTAKPK